MARRSCLLSEGDKLVGGGEDVQGQHHVSLWWGEMPGRGGRGSRDGEGSDSRPGRPMQTQPELAGSLGGDRLDATS